MNLLYPELPVDLRQRRSYRTRAARPPQWPLPRASPRQVVWFILRAASSAKNTLEQVYRASPEIGRLAQLAQSFFRMFKERYLQALLHGLKPHKERHWQP